ncbi:glycoside hydrolase family 61 protein, partial [Hypoxylon sp. CI-4A]
AHGGIFNYTIDSVDYAGHYPFLPEEGQDSIQRRWWPDPIYRADHPYLACNRGYPLATSLPKEHAPVRAGGEVTAWWTAPPCPLNPPYPWQHHQGPVMVYMADCGGPCDQWDGTGKRWFKIWETGYNKTGWGEYANEGKEWSIGGSVYVWEQARIVPAGFSVTIPKTLKPGHYMIRHEIINLEASLQFFPNCAQLEVSGDGDRLPSEDYLAEFPGAYKLEDPGIAVAG